MFTKEIKCCKIINANKNEINNLKNFYFLLENQISGYLYQL